jgi:hypothetical protein
MIGSRRCTWPVAGRPERVWSVRDRSRTSSRLRFASEGMTRKSWGMSRGHCETVAMNVKDPHPASGRPLPPGEGGPRSRGIGMLTNRVPSIGDTTAGLTREYDRRACQARTNPYDKRLRRPVPRVEGAGSFFPTLTPQAAPAPAFHARRGLRPAIRASTPSAGDDPSSSRPQSGGGRNPHNTW